MMEKTKNLPIDVYIMISSCVPATPFDESAYTLNSEDVEKCFKLDNTGRILGLAEMMNYPGVINGDPEVLAKIKLSRDLGKRVDGHAPGLSGEALVKYISAGIESDHECSTLEEAIEKLEVAKKLNQEFYIMIREGTAARNLEALAELMNKDEYKNSDYFVDAVKMARKYEKSHDKLIIVAGACQSNYEEIIKAGANFASSPKRINIHALDPAIIASSISLSLKNKPIDLLNILSKTKYGPDGIGGLVTTGTMYVGYPR